MDRSTPLADKPGGMQMLFVCVLFELYYSKPCLSQLEVLFPNIFVKPCWSIVNLVGHL